MNTKYISIVVLAIVAVLSGCTKNPCDTPSTTNGLADLELSYVGAIESKAVIDGTTFPQTGEIALFLFLDEVAGTPYGESGYTNIKYSYDTTKDKWIASPSIKVGSAAGYLYGYYPYSSTATDIKAIPVKSSLNGDDVMYATKQTVTDATAAQTAITMNHALARVTVTVKNNGYTGEAKLSKIKFSGAEIAESGTLNALDGSVSAEKNDVTLDVTGEARTITSSGTTYECLLVPSEVETDRQTMNLTLTIDGNDKQATLSGDNGVIMAGGTKSNITITLSDSGISVQTVSVEDWNVVEAGGHKVTIAAADGIDPNDILTKAYVDGEDVIINACSKIGNYLKCTLPGGEFCPQSKTSNMVYTFILSDISSDVTATIGYANPITLNFSSSNNKDWGMASFTGDCYEGHKINFTATVKGSRCEFVEWQDADGEKLDWQNPQDITLTSDLTVKAVFNAPAGALSVSYDDGETTRQIHFSPGNLWYGKTGSATEAGLQFENQQYEFHTYDSEYNTWGLFGWPTYESDFPFGMSTSTLYTDYSGAFKDWDGNTWRTLTINEWKYLLEGRQSAVDKVGYATVNDVHGIIILPDSFTDPKTNTGGGPFVPKSTTGWDANVYTTGGNWEAMENAGAVFLPAAGRRYASDIFYDGEQGTYWSSTNDHDSKAYPVSFTDGIIKLNQSVERIYGCCVRLVTEYQSEPGTE